MLYSNGDDRNILSFPTRRTSDQRTDSTADSQAHHRHDGCVGDVEESPTQQMGEVQAEELAAEMEATKGIFNIMEDI